MNPLRILTFKKVVLHVVCQRPLKSMECAAKYNVSESEIKAAMDRMDQWIGMPQPKSYTASQLRPDAMLFRLAFLTEVSAFEKLKVMSFHLTACARASSGQSRAHLGLAGSPTWQ
jgi:hypothetical protein